MKKKLGFTAVFCLMMISLVVFPIPIWAVDDGLSELEKAENIWEKESYQLEKPAKDPFKPLLKRPFPTRPIKEKETVVFNPDPKPEPVKTVPPLKLNLIGIVGNEKDRLAMVRFENSIRFFKKNDGASEKFRVIDILPDKIVVYSEKEQMRRTFSIYTDK